MLLPGRESRSCSLADGRRRDPASASSSSSSRLPLPEHDDAVDAGSSNPASCLLAPVHVRRLQPSPPFRKHPTRPGLSTRNAAAKTPAAPPGRSRIDAQSHSPCPKANAASATAERHTSPPTAGTRRAGGIFRTEGPSGVGTRCSVGVERDGVGYVGRSGDAETENKNRPSGASEPLTAEDDDDGRRSRARSPR